MWMLRLRVCELMLASIYCYAMLRTMLKPW